MSHIFDALQRSEAERSGKPVSPLAAVTELLERAERGAASRRDAAPDLEQVSPFHPSESERDYLPRKLSAVAEAEVLSEPDPRAADEGMAELAQCQTLHLSLTPQNRLVAVSDIDSPAAEAFRLLSVRLRHLRRDQGAQKTAHHQHDSAGRQEHGFGEPGLRAGFFYPAQDIAAGRRCAQAFPIEGVRSKGASRAL